MTTIPMTAETIKPRNKTRAWALRLPAAYEGRCAATFHWTAQVVLTADDAGVITALVDGEPDTVAHAVMLLEWARAEGDCVQLYEEYTDTLDKPAAHRLHRELGELRIRGHYEFAAGILGREIDSLTQVRRSEVPMLLAAAELAGERAS